MTALRFTVYGVAATAGSKKAYPYQKRDGKLGVRVTDDNPRSRDWKQQVASIASEACGRGALLAGPLALTVTFFRPRPKGHFRKGGALSKAGLESSAPDVRPDLTKLVRGLEDALRGVLWRDDAQVVEQANSKRWGEPARAEVVVATLLPDTVVELDRLAPPRKLLHRELKPEDLNHA